MLLSTTLVTAVLVVPHLPHYPKDNAMTNNNRNTTANRRLWAMASRLDHGFTTHCVETNGTWTPVLPDFDSSFEEFDKACAALEKARGDNWPGISGWPRLASGEARWVTGSGRTAISVLPNGDVIIRTDEEGAFTFDWVKGGDFAFAPAGTVTIRGREAKVEGNPSHTGMSLLAAIAADEGWPLDADEGAAWLRSHATSDAASASLWLALADVVESTPVALPGPLLTVRWEHRAAAVIRHLRTLPWATAMIERRGLTAAFAEAEAFASDSLNRST